MEIYSLQSVKDKEKRASKVEQSIKQYLQRRLGMICIFLTLANVTNVYFCHVIDILL